MKINLLLGLALTASTMSRAQEIDKQTLLGAVGKSVDRIVEGKYIFNDNYTRISTEEEPRHSFSQYYCYFKKNDTDSMVGYKLSSISKDGRGAEYIYDGDQLFTNYPSGEKLVVTGKKLYPDQIARFANESRYFPYFLYRWRELRMDEVFARTKMLGREVFQGMPCYKIQTDAPVIKALLKAETYYYISADSFMPVGELTRWERKIGDAVEKTEFEYWISHVDVQTPVSDSQFTKEKLSPHKKEVAYHPDGERKDNLLSPGTAAPDWRLPTLDNRTLQLSALKGRVVIMDFWYKACVPCQHQMIALQQLHDKFDKGKVAFVSVNTTDDPVSGNLKDFLGKRNITMLSVYNGKSIQKAYGVYSAPVLYVIDKHGKVVYSLAGYAENLLPEVARVIAENM